MKLRFSFLFLVLCLSAWPVRAQKAEVSAKSAVSPVYDVAKEVTLTATVSQVVKKTTPEMKTLPGAHLMLETSSGTVDASVGGFALRGKDALAVKAGDPVKVTGVMKKIRDKRVFVVRLVQVNGHIYQIRNEHGFLLAAASRKGITKSQAQGGQL